jgi:putative transposase
MKTRKPYPSDLTDSQWANLEPYFPPPAREGRPRTIELRDICNAYWYLLRSGGSWRMLPHDFPAWETVYSQVRRWKEMGVWENIHNRLRDDLRLAEGRPLEPSAAALDSQTVKTADHGGPRGFDAGKKNRRPQTACAG